MAITKDQFIQLAESKGWTKDKFGHLQKSTNIKDYRFKISSISVRYEVKVHHNATEYSKANNEWVRIRSGYYKDLSITSDGKLAGLK
jgi:hypothetical protein